MVNQLSKPTMYFKVPESAYDTETAERVLTEHNYTYEVGDFYIYVYLSDHGETGACIEENVATLVRDFGQSVYYRKYYDNTVEEVEACH